MGGAHTTRQVNWPDSEGREWDLTQWTGRQDHQPMWPVISESERETLRHLDERIQESVTRHKPRVYWNVLNGSANAEELQPGHEANLARLVELGLVDQRPAFSTGPNLSLVHSAGASVLGWGPGLCLRPPVSRFTFSVTRKSGKRLGHMVMNAPLVQWNVVLRARELRGPFAGLIDEIRAWHSSDPAPYPERLRGLMVAHPTLGLLCPGTAQVSHTEDHLLLSGSSWRPEGTYERLQLPARSLKLSALETRDQPLPGTLDRPHLMAWSSDVILTPERWKAHRSAGISVVELQLRDATVLCVAERWTHVKTIRGDHGMRRIHVRLEGRL